MDESKRSGSCHFDILFTKSVPHILEDIFFSLDYESFNTCLKVNNAWHELLASESCKKKGIYVFYEEILKDEVKLW